VSGGRDGKLIIVNMTEDSEPFTDTVLMLYWAKTTSFWLGHRVNSVAKHQWVRTAQKAKPSRPFPRCSVWPQISQAGNKAHRFPSAKVIRSLWRPAGCYWRPGFRHTHKPASAAVSIFPACVYCPACRHRSFREHPNDARWRRPLVWLWIAHGQQSHSKIALLLRPLQGRESVLWWPICMSVSSRAYLRNCVSDLHRFYARYICPWLGPPLAALRYVMYFRFYGWRHVCT